MEKKVYLNILNQMGQQSIIDYLKKIKYKIKMMDKYSSNLPKKMYSKGILLKEYVGEMAWYHSDAIKVIEVLEKAGCKILGGDVYFKSDGIFKSTYDNWYYKNDSNDNPVLESAKIAKEYIETYHRNNGKNYHASKQCEESLQPLYIKSYSDSFFPYNCQRQDYIGQQI